MGVQNGASPDQGCVEYCLCCHLWGLQVPTNHYQCASKVCRGFEHHWNVHRCSQLCNQCPLHGNQWLRLDGLFRVSDGDGTIGLLDFVSSSLQETLSQGHCCGN